MSVNGPSLLFEGISEFRKQFLSGQLDFFDWLPIDGNMKIYHHGRPYV